MTDLHTLPTELLLQIISYLPPSASTSLKLVNKEFFYRTPGIASIAFKSCNPCERKAFNRFINENVLLRRKQRRCVLCDGVQGADFFLRGSVPICKWHDGWFFRASIPPNLESKMRDKALRRSSTVMRPQWIALKRLYCAHQQDIIGWDIRDCSCECQSCGHFEVDCFVRVSPRYVGP